MNVRIMFWVCLIVGIIQAIKTMSNCRKYGRPVSSVDKGFVGYFIGL